MYPIERSLVKKYAQSPFALIGVNSDGKKQVLEAIKSNSISWRSFWDGPGGPIARKWNILGWPTVVLIDHKGIIRSREHVLDLKLLRKLIEEAESHSPQKDR